jgi:RNA polymerase sigma-70 factor (family 1)
LPASEHHTKVQLHALQQMIAGGDENAFTQIYLDFSKKLIQFAISIVRSKEIAEELVEDVFVKLWSNRSRIEQIENLAVYLYVSVKNKALNALSLKANALVSAPFNDLDTTIPEFAPDPHDLLITVEMMNRMKEAIESLPPRCKMIFRLVREDGLKYKEVGEILNISVNTIDVQMAIAVKRICLALQIDKSGKTFHDPFLSYGQKNVQNS